MRRTRRMRAAFAHDAVVVVEPGGDPAALGGAVTLELCGSFAHPPLPRSPGTSTSSRPGGSAEEPRPTTASCPVAPHHTRADRDGGAVTVRVLFAVEPADEEAVRARIDRALASGYCDGPDGVRTRWTVRSSAAGVVSAAEREHAARLVAG
jgi:hypothetical protein